MKQSNYLSFIKNSRDGILIILGVLSAGLGLKGFLLPNQFTDGGVTGIAILTSIKTGVPLSILIFVFNIPFLIIGYRQISKLFAIKTLIGIILLAICTAYVPYPVITQDKLLIAAFGGFFLGAGIGLCMRGGGVIDGTEVLALNISKKSVFSIGDVILSINLVIFSVAILILGYEKALYSILTYLVASKTIDFIIHGLEEYTGVTIVSVRSEEVRRAIIDVMKRGVTIYKGERGYGRHLLNENSDENKLDILYCVVTRLEVQKLKTIINTLDPHAFIVMQSINEIKGGMVKRRPFSE
jgi:uncharacterized membrane-anchored protein YitT (DUF2179 family)